MAVTHTTTIAFGSFNPVLLQVMPDNSRPCSSYTTPSAQPSLGASHQSAPTDNEEGWTLVTDKRIRKPRPQATRSKLEQGRKNRCRNNRKPKKSIRAAKPMYVGEPMEQEPRIPISLLEYFPKDFFQHCTTTACHMVEVEIKEPSKGKAIAIEEEKTFMKEKL